MLTVLISLLMSLIITPPSLVASIPAPQTPCQINIPGFTVNGVFDSGACRYAVEYAQAQRWGVSTLTTSFNGQVSTSMPHACPQDSSVYVTTSQSENCLWNVIYTPSAPAPVGGRPVFVWIHGGSSIQGSASAPGLDGAHLATTGNIIVVVLQYRLGILGFMPPSQAPTSIDPNLGLQDIINSLKSIHTYAAIFGGDPNRVTIGGQSSGGGMVRALLGAPAARGLFRAGIIQSDPMTYGFSSTSITSQLQKLVYSTSPLSGCSTYACLQTTSVTNILAAQDLVIQTAPYSVTGVPVAEVIRPTFGPPTLPSDPTQSLFSNPSALSASRIPLLITTVANEGGQAVSQILSSPTPPSNATYLSILSALTGSQPSSSSRQFGPILFTSKWRR